MVPQPNTQHPKPITKKNALTSSSNDFSSKVAFWTLVVFFCFSSFAFGCMESWSIATCEVMLFAGAAVAGWKDGNFWKWPKHLRIPALFVVVLIAVGFIQLIPLPAAVWQYFHADRTAIYTEGAKAEALLHTPPYTHDPFALDQPTTANTQNFIRSSTSTQNSKLNTHNSLSAQHPTPITQNSIKGSTSTQNSTLNTHNSLSISTTQQLNTHNSLSAQNPTPKTQNSPQSWTALTPSLPAWLPASFTPMATARAIVALLAVGCLILLLERVLADKNGKAKRLAFWVGLLGLGVALVALVQYAEHKTKILWLRQSHYAKGAFGPFVNPNHGEVFVNLAFPLLYYLLWRRSLRQDRPGNRWGIRVLILGLFGLHMVLLAVSHSRGAYLALALYPPVLLGYLAFKRKTWAAWAAAACLAAIVAGLGLAMWTGVLTDDGRLRLDENIPFHHVFVGNGLNSFAQRFPSIVTDQPLMRETFNTHLENEYLQTFFEAGLVPALLLLGAAVVAILLGLKALKLGNASFWMVPAFCAETCHASVDFIGHVFPIVAAYLLIWGLLHRTTHNHEHRSAAAASG